MKHSNKKMLAIAVTAAMSAPIAAWATNGMNLEGYGPIAHSMGGASMAYDNGTAAVMNNPATLGLMGEGSRLDAALGFLGPDVKAGSNSSGGDSYYMPAVGWAKSQGELTYGVGVFAQGGMGTEYKNGVYVPSKEERSEVGVGRFIVPLAYKVNDQVNVGGSLDYVWAGMDLQMAMPGSQFFSMVGMGLISGSLLTTFQPLLGAPYGGAGPINVVNYGYFDFSNSSDFTGEAKGSGFAGKLGVTFKVNPQLTLGATYHSKTSMSDLKTSNASMAMSVTGDFDGNAATPDTTMELPLTGKIKINDFEWPATYGLGMAYQANDKLMVALDVKRINWSSVMENFSMTFTADNNNDYSGMGMPNFNGTVLDATMPQNWDNQTVISLGGAYQVNDQFTVRAGFNKASNPIPSDTVNYLFPATVEKHITAGVGYSIDKAQSVDFSIAHASEFKIKDANGTTISHSQMNWQFMYSHLF